jgi:hypothetical protein
MSVFYKFASSKEFDACSFEGPSIQLSNLKKLIIEQKKLGKATDFDLLVTNAQTNQIFKNEYEQIPKNTSVIIQRVPVVNNNNNNNVNIPGLTSSS